jgi:hypothetical protein
MNAKLPLRLAVDLVRDEVEERPREVRLLALALVLANCTPLFLSPLFRFLFLWVSARAFAFALVAVERIRASLARVKNVRLRLAGSD